MANLKKKLKNPSLSASPSDPGSVASTPLTEPEAIPLDQRLLGEVKGMIGGKSLRTVLMVYLGDGQGRLQKMHQASIEKDFQALKILIHGLKGASAQVGALALNRLLLRVENLCHSGTDPKAIQQGLEEIEGEWIRVTTALTEYMDTTLS